MYDDKMVELYQHMVRERHQIWLARQHGVSYPWTEDPVLANRKFTNMFRVLDPGSQFVFRLDHHDEHSTLARLIFYRLTNLPSTWEVMKSVLGRYPDVGDFADHPEVIDDILHAHRAAGNRVFSGAYIIIPEPGTANDKIEGAIRVVNRFFDNYVDDFFYAETQDERFKALRSSPGLGPFLSMQILTDWTYLQPEEPDHSFIVAGPGAKRGTQLIEPSAKPEDVIRDMAVYWQDHPDVRLGDRGLTVMDVQNTFCEFSKYAREIEYPRKKTPYKPAHPGAQPTPILPRWW